MTIKILEKSIFEKRQKPAGHKAFTRKTRTGKISQVKEKPYVKKQDIREDMQKEMDKYLEGQGKKRGRQVFLVQLFESNQKDLLNNEDYAWSSGDKLLTDKAAMKLALHVCENGENGQQVMVWDDYSNLPVFTLVRNWKGVILKPFSKKQLKPIDFTTKNAQERKPSFTRKGTEKAPIPKILDEGENKTENERQEWVTFAIGNKKYKVTRSSSIGGYVSPYDYNIEAL